MEFNLKDRMIILNSVLPQFDTRANMILKMSIDSKIALTATEQNNVVMKPAGGNIYEYGFKDVSAINDKHEYIFTDDELMYMKQRVDSIDKNGMFSTDTMPTYLAILDASFIGEEAQSKWDTYIGNMNSL